MPRRRYRLLLALLVAGSLAAYLAGNNGPSLWDRDEPRYAVTSLEMLRSGDWVVPRFLGEVRTAKPPAIYWLQATAMRVLGANDFAVRLPGALSCAATLVILGLGLPPVVGRRRAIWACFLLGTSVLVLGVAKVGVIDGAMLPCAALVQVCLLRLVSARQPAPRGTTLLLWGAIGVGGLLKGPILLGVFVTTLLALGLLRWSEGCFKARRADAPGSSGFPRPMGCSPWAWSAFMKARGAKTPDFGGDSRENRASQQDSIILLLRRTRPFLGLLVLTLVVGPWLVLIQLREPDFLRTTIAHDLFARSTGGLEGHGRPPGFHLLCLAGTWFPWSVLLPGVIVHAWRRRRVSFVSVALAGCLGPWTMFELVATKLPHYLLPIFPMLAVLTADWLVRARRGRFHLDRRGFVAAAAIYAVVAVGFGVVPWATGGNGVASSLVAVAWAMVSLWAWPRPRERLAKAVVITGVGITATVAVAYATWLPRAEVFTRSKQIAAALAEAGAAEAILVDYKEPSLAWYAARRGVTVREANREAMETAGGFAVVTPRAQERRPPAVRGRWHVAARAADVWVVQAAAADAATPATP